MVLFSLYGLGIFRKISISFNFIEKVFPFFLHVSDVNRPDKASAAIRDGSGSKNAKVVKIDGF